MWVGNALTVLHSLINNTLNPPSIATELVSGQYVSCKGQLPGVHVLKKTDGDGEGITRTFSCMNKFKKALSMAV